MPGWKTALNQKRHAQKPQLTLSQKVALISAALQEYIKRLENLENMLKPQSGELPIPSPQLEGNHNVSSV